ncbi:MAG: hypothetical protein KF708_07845 [Pirellulales bacterium]|nr:hypothetical protein [Pirellulales bacterium]
MPTQHDNIVPEVQRLREEVRVLRDVLDEIRDELIWAIRNERLLFVRTETTCAPSEASDESADPPATGPVRQIELW